VIEILHLLLYLFFQINNSSKVGRGKSAAVSRLFTTLKKRPHEFPVSYHLFQNIMSFY